MLNMIAKQLAVEYRLAYAQHYKQSQPSQASADNLRRLEAAYKVAKEYESFGLR